MSDFDTWVASLPDMPGLEDVKVLLKGRNGEGLELSVVIERLQGSPSWCLGFVAADEPEAIGDVADDCTVGFTVSQRFGHLKLEYLLEYIKGHHYWMHRYDELVEKIIRHFLYVKAIDEEAFEAELIQRYGDRLNEWPFVMLAPKSIFHARLMGILRLEALGDSDGSDPRHLVRELAHRPIMSGGYEVPRIRLYLRSELTDDWENYGEAVLRRLLAVLQGASLIDGQPESGVEIAEHGLELACGSYNESLWRKLDTDKVNDYLHYLPNDPVLAIERGGHPMQVLVVLAYEPDEQELDRLLNVEGVRHAALAEPKHVYGRITASLLVPGSHKASVFRNLQKGVRKEMSFFT